MRRPQVRLLATAAAVTVGALTVTVTAGAVPLPAGPAPYAAPPLHDGVTAHGATAPDDTTRNRRTPRTEPKPFVMPDGPAPTVFDLTGPDFSHWSHHGDAPIDWSAIAESGQQFVFMKATEGTTHVDEWFERDWAGTRRAGVPRGAYHFANPGSLSSAKEQARHFADTIGRVDRPGDLPPVLDLESSGGLSPASLITWTRTWLRTVERRTGRTPIIYTGMSFWQTAMANSKDFTRYPLWVAYYPSDTRLRPVRIGGWASWTLWQYTSSASLRGVPSSRSDHNVYAGTAASLDRLALQPLGYRNPVGRIAAVSTDPGRVRVSGWAVDRDTTTPVTVRLRTDGRIVLRERAGQRRPAAPEVHPGAGRNHGFTMATDLAPGRHRVCVEIVNVGAGTDTPLGCRIVFIAD